MRKFGVNPQWSVDGQKIYYWNRDRAPEGIVERDIATGMERNVLLGQFQWDFVVSPDGKYIVVRTALDPNTKDAHGRRPSSGDASREPAGFSRRDPHHGVYTG
ncbi:MAG: hypothetical protein ACRD2N_16940 [Vicinamibacterales bacterium]